MAATLGSWLLLYVVLFVALAAGGWLLRHATDRPWSDRSILRGASGGGFVVATIAWLGLGALSG